MYACIKLDTKEGRGGYSHGIPVIVRLRGPEEDASALSLALIVEDKCQ